MQRYNPAARHRKLLFIILPVLLLLIGGGAYAAINLTAQKPAQHAALKPGVNIDQGQKGLVGEWKLNNSTKDSTPYQDNGTLVNNPTPTTDRKNTPNGAYAFDANDQYVSVPNSAALSQTGDFSISAWIKPGVAQQATQAHFISKYDQTPGTANYILAYDNSGTKLRFIVGSDTLSRITVTSTQTVADPSQWYHVVGERSGNLLKLYINGQLSATGAISGATSITATPLRIGWDASTSPFVGSISDVRLYNRALSASEIQNLYNSYDSQVNTCTTSCTVNLAAGLIGYWPFDGNANDATPYQNNGTVNGATLTTGHTGAANTAYSFNGTTDNIQASTGGSFGFPNTTFTVSLWLKSASSTFVTWNGTTFCQGWGIIGDGNFWLKGFSLDMSKNCQQDVYNTTSADKSLIQNGAWHQLTYIVTTSTNGTANSMKLYIDGVLDKGSSSPQILYQTGPPTASLLFGQRPPSPPNNWAGSLQDIRIYNRPLNAAEVQALYNLPD